MALNFPDSPSNGDTVTLNGVTYTYVSSGTYWSSGGSGGGSGASPAIVDSSGTPTLATGITEAEIKTLLNIGSGGATEYANQAALPTSGLTVGQLAFIQDTNQLAVAESTTNWTIFNRDATTSFSASGGTETTYTGNGTNGTNGTSYKVHTFTSSANFVTTGTGSMDILIVAGGGGGGGGTGDTHTSTGGCGGIGSGGLVVVTWWEVS